MWMKNPIFGTGKSVVVYSGFFVLKGIVGMLAHGVYGTTVIKKIYIGPSNAKDIPLSHYSDTRRLVMFMLFLVI